MGTMNDHAPLLADPEHGVVDDVVDVATYPIDTPGTQRWTAMVESVRASLAADGCAVLSDFLTPSGLRRADQQLSSIAPKAAIRDWSSSVYARNDDEAGLDDDDPRKLAFDNRLGQVTRDQIAPDHVLARLYVSPMFKTFVAACLGVERVFEYADPLAGLIATIIPPGGCKAWHYDTNELTVTIMTRQSRGGDFEFCPNLRSPGDENLDGLRRVLTEEPADIVRRKALCAGDLQLFLGRYSLHRVTDVLGPGERHVAVLSYAERPGVIGPVDRTRTVYGRVTEAHLLAEQFAVAEHDGLIA